MMGAAAAAAQASDPIAELITTYHELNSSLVEELAEEPSPLEFMRYVARNTPFVVRGGASDWQATKTWDVQYLTQFLRDHSVNVAVTPLGNADAPTLDERGDTVFAKPHEEEQSFPDFIEYLTKQETDPKFQGSEIRYAQTQNDNLRHEYRALFSQVQRSVPFARIALQQDPDAINLWIGNARSVTALHRDNYENVYVQVAGRKHFVLLPPLCQPCVHERPLRPAHYARRRQDPGRGGGAGGDDKTGNGSDANNADLELVMEEDADDVPFATWDPDNDQVNATKYSHLATPMRVTLEPGDMFYLPAMWYHKVSQSANEEGVCIAVNYWYDMEFSGPLYPLVSFVRNINSMPEESSK
ncbi:phospholipase A2 [Apiospora aurea]|uniref:Phospholipase A2 n=1 Tax=Apiospora aurea TaxID=335848 RepID=A0ABR1QVA3_9PEZI